MSSAIADHIPAVTVLDDQGENELDQASDPGNSQQDLTGALIAPHGEFGWYWDELDLSGNNSIDTCTYFQTNDATVVSSCYSVQFEADGSITPGFPEHEVFDCGSTYDSKQQKCTGNNEISSEYEAECLPPTAADPLFTGDDQDDLFASCTLYLAGSTTTADELRLLNTCTKTSASPSSNSNDCIFSELPAFLKLVKAFPENTDYDAAVTDWTLTASSAEGNVVLEAEGETPLTPVPSDLGPYTLSESGPDGYGLASLTCVTDGGEPADLAFDPTLEIVAGTATVCTFVNELQSGSLSLIKHVENNHGGMADPGDWWLFASDTTGIALSTNGPYPATAEIAAGTYALREAGDATASSSGPAGYTLSSLTCTDTGDTQVDSVTINAGESTTCTFVNSDTPATLTLKKIVEDPNGYGSNTASDWTLSANGTPFVQDMPTNVSAGSYTLSESGPGGYDASDWSCEGGMQTGDQITLGLGESATCSITNTIIPATLTLVKIVEDPKGYGSNTASDWTLSANGSPFIQNTPTDVPAGSYTLSESGPDGYAASDWFCEGGSQLGDQIALALGESATCTITNTIIPATLTLIKNVVNDDGGPAMVADFPLYIDGNIVNSGVSVEVAPGQHVVSETSQPGYTTDGWKGDCAVDGAITLTPGQAATCTITNNDVAPRLRLVKELANIGFPGAAGDTPDQWTLTASATGAPTLSGNGDTGFADVRAGLDYALSESGPSGYEAGDWQCDGGNQSGNRISLDLAQDVTCTIVNSYVRQCETAWAQGNTAFDDLFKRNSSWGWATELKASDIDLTTGVATYAGDILAGQTLDVGDYQIIWDGSSAQISVTVSDADWAAEDFHVYADSRKPGKSSPGRFTYSSADLAWQPGQTSYSTVIPLQDSGKGSAWILIHAVVCEQPLF